MRGHDKKLLKVTASALLFAGLASVSIAIGSGAAKSAGNRLLVKCAAEEQSDKASFICRMLTSSGFDDFFGDNYGGVVQLSSPVQTEVSPVDISHESFGPAGRGGARNVAGTYEVVDGAGRVTHRNFSPVQTKPYDSNSASVTVVGDAGSSPISINTTPPVEGVNSGSAVFLGDAKSIDISTRGRDGAAGRSAGISAALAVLRGELGVSDAIKSLAARFNLGSSVSEPTVSASGLAESAGRCEEVGTGAYTTPTNIGSSDYVMAFTERAREIVAARAACERQTSQEFAIQTQCVRPAEIDAKIRCEYPKLIQNAPIWRHPVDNKKIQITCANQVPDGHWNTTCARERQVVIGSAFRTDYVTLAPSQSIKDGMAEPLYHAFSTSAGCKRDPYFLGYLPTDIQLSDFSYSTFIDSSLFTSKTYLETLRSSCASEAMRKMDLLRLSGALVYKNQRNAMPGTDDERLAGSVDYRTSDITKLSYWSDRGSEAPVDPQDLPKRVPYDEFATDAPRNAHFHALDPATTSDTTESAARSDYWKGLEFLGYQKPTVSNAVISYDRLTAKRQFLQKGDSQSRGEGHISTILCRLTSSTGGNFAAYYAQRQSAGANLTESKACEEFLKARYSYDDNDPTLQGLRFREKLEYTFSNLKSGVALLRPDAQGDQSVPSQLRSVASAEFEPRALYIPGSLEVAPITKVSYCKKIHIDDSAETLVSTNNTYNFIGPEIYGGATYDTWETYLTDDFRDRNTSPEAANNASKTQSIFPWANSFLKVRTSNPASENASCDQITVTHELTGHEKEVLEKFKNTNGILITANGNKITVYMSPVKIPKAGGKLVVSESLSPGLYLPRVNVSPMTLAAPGLHNSNIWAGEGVPRRYPLGSSQPLGAERFPWDDTFSSSSSVTMSAQFGLGIEYFAVPRLSGSPDASNDQSYPFRSFKAAGTLSPSGSAAADESSGRAVLGNSSRDKPRYIKVLRSLDLGIDPNNPQASATSIKKENVRSYGDVLLTSRIGTTVGEAMATCGANALNGSLKYPTKLISRRAEAIKDGNDSRQGDANVIAHPEVSDSNGSRNWPVENEYRFFTRPYLPTSMVPAAFSDRFLEEPINLAQDYNSFLAQIQTNTSIARTSSGQVTLKDPNTLNDCQGGSEAQYRPSAAYDFHLDARCELQRFKDVGNRKPFMQEWPTWNDGVKGAVSQQEVDCLNGSDSEYCIEYRPNDPYRSNRPPYFIHGADGAIDRGTNGTHNWVIGNTAANMFKGVRPFDQTARGGDGWNGNNIPCDDPNNTSSWLGRTSDSLPSTCYPNLNFFAGHFFPFLRTAKDIFSGSKDRYEDGGAAQTIWANALGRGNTSRTFRDTDLPLGPMYSLGGLVGGFGKITGGVNDDEGGATFNPTSFQLPPVGVSASLKFQRFNANYNKNCTDVRTILTNTDDYELVKRAAELSGQPFNERIYCQARPQLCEDICQSNDDVHKPAASLHAFHGSDKQFGYYGNVEPPPPQEAFPGRSIGDTANTDANLRWIGVSGYIFSGCGDNLVSTSMINLPTNTVTVDALTATGVNVAKLNGFPYSLGILPTGLTMADEGGLYYGPLVGSSLAPVIGGADGGIALASSSTFATNALIVQQSRRFADGVALYSSSGLAGQITDPSYHWDQADSAGGSITLRRDGSEKRMATVGRILADAASDLELSVAPKYGYEPEIALLPEVLAAFFLHSSIDSNVEPSASSPAQKGQSLDPFALATAEQSPSYFAQMVGDFLNPTQRNELARLKFTKNEFAISQSATGPTASRLYVRPMLFAFGSSDQDLIKFAWSWDDHSVHATVKSVSTNDGVGSIASGLNADGTVDLRPLGGIEGVHSGVAVSYGGNGILGGLSDDYTYTVDGQSKTILRSEGLSNPAVRDLKLKLHAMEVGSVSGTSVGDYVDPSERNSGAGQFEFAENYCSRQRGVWVKSSFNFKNKSSDQSYLRPFDKICKAAALYSVDTNSSSPGIHVGLIQDDTGCSGKCEPNDGAGKNIYWTWMRVDDESVVTTGTDPNNPPSCPTGDRLKSQTYVVTGSTESATFLASTNWQGACGTPGNVLCPGDGQSPYCPIDKPVQIGAVFTALYSQPDTCYDSFSGKSIPDVRSDRTSLTCPKPSALSGIFAPTTIDGTKGTFKEYDTIEGSSFPTPTGSYAAYNIFVGTRQVGEKSIEEIKPGSLFKETGWIKASDYYSQLTCDAVAYDPFTGADSSLAPDGMPKLSARWSFVEVARRYGAFDPYFVKTASKQTLLPTGGGAINIAAAADSCDWGGGTGNSPAAPAFDAPQRRPDQVDDGSGETPSDYHDFTQPIGYEWVGGASSNLTTLQFTPWSTERTDGDSLNAPSCAIFNDSENISQEKLWSNAPDISGLFKIGAGDSAKSFRPNIAGSPDSSLGNTYPNFVTGGQWVQVGLEQKQLTKVNNTLPVSCKIYINSSFGQDSCDAAIPITYETVNGYQIAIRAENGEHGGNAGQAIVLTTFEPDHVAINAAGGVAGAAGGTELAGASSERELICYEKNKDPLAPYLKIYRFNKSVVSVAAASAGNAGRGTQDSAVYGWGVMPDAINWLKKAIVDKARTSSP